MTEFWIIYEIIGFVLGARVSCHVAWGQSRKKAKHELDWWYTPAPLLTLLGCMLGWPAMAAGYGLVKGGLFAPPREARKAIKAAKLKELESEVL